MFHSSSHRKYWIFPNVEEVDKLRLKCIETFSSKYLIPTNDLVTVDEQKLACQYYEQKLWKLCLKFQPPLPYSVIYTAFVYFKRVYLRTSLMENLPQDMLSVCLYMACKVEEYNVSVDKFVLIYPEADRPKAADAILGNEMNLMRLLNYHLIVHSPKRALEGFLIDIKTRFHQGGDPEMFREMTDEFLNAALFTDVVLLYAPSQIALAALLRASREVIHKYIVSVLASGQQGNHILEKVHDISRIIERKQVYENNQVTAIMGKLSRIKLPEKGKTKKRKTSVIGTEEPSKRQRALNSIDGDEMVE